MPFLIISSDLISFQIVKRMMQKECRCHGVSGSCELQICRLKGRKFTEISEEIFGKFYSNARYVQSSGKIDPTKKELIFGRRSIDYCRSNHFLDYTSVSAGRECFTAEACEKVCCSRGYQALNEVKTIENCHCFFSWNIVNIQCTSCEKKVTRMICT